MNTTNKILMGILAVLTVGVAVGILVAPKSGAETRNGILKKGGNAVNGIREKVADQKRNLQNMKDSVLNSVEEILNRDL